ncbi:hypothetical protein C8R43DRAFT_1023565 [Mycena crocata]|nr:hypothetical protein C8R43DRAFT_1023565 [Mycena crocata]
MAPPPRRLSQKPAPRRATIAQGSPISARRAMVASAPNVVKSSQHNLPYWQVADAGKARAADGRRFAAMTVGNRGRGQTASDYQDITDKKFAFSNMDIRKEYESKDAPRPMGRKAARKIEEQPPQLHSDDESTGSPSDSEWETDSELEPPETDQEDSSDSDVEITEIWSSKPPVIELLDDTPPMSPVIRPSTPSDELIGAIERLTLAVTSMQELHRLPFLKRNVRRGFASYCKDRGVPIESHDSPTAPIHVSFKFSTKSPPHQASISCWECPLCQLHLPFPTKDMLETHIKQDHGEVLTRWEERDGKGKWRLEVSLTAEEDINLLSSSPTMEMSLPAPHLDFSPEPIELPNHLGPTARFPFLPAKSEFGGPDLKYSVRFGGPKVYDLLDLLPMEPYGIWAWSVLDREEEIFESDDLTDHQKVIHAVWARWIVLNRNLFIANYYNGAKKFIDENWKMIRLAAGWNVLRYWLVGLMTNDFLTAQEIGTLLRRYESWCSGDDLF